MERAFLASGSVDPGGFELASALVVRAPVSNEVGQQHADERVPAIAAGSGVAAHDDVRHELETTRGQRLRDFDPGVIAGIHRRDLELDHVRLGGADGLGLFRVGVAGGTRRIRVGVGPSFPGAACPSAVLTAALAWNSWIWTCRCAATTLACVLAIAVACWSSLRVSSASRCVSYVTFSCSAILRSVSVVISASGGVMSPMRVSTATTL